MFLILLSHLVQLCHWNDRYCKMDAYAVGVVKDHVYRLVKGVRKIDFSGMCNLEPPCTSDMQRQY